MSSRRLACVLLGIWLGGGFMMAWVAVANFRSADRLLTVGDPGALIRLTPLGHAESRALVRHAVSEQNRDLFETWEYAQIFLGIFFFAFVLLGTREGKFALALALLMLLLVLVQRFGLTPPIIAVGRRLDFAPGAGPAGDRARFNLLHSTYIVVELLKWAAGILLVAILVVHGPKRSRSKNAGQELNLVDKPDNGHVDG